MYLVFGKFLFELYREVCATFNCELAILDLVMSWVRFSLSFLSLLAIWLLTRFRLYAPTFLFVDSLGLPVADSGLADWAGFLFCLSSFVLIWEELIRMLVARRLCFAGTSPFSPCIAELIILSLTPDSSRFALKNFIGTVELKSSLLETGWIFWAPEDLGRLGIFLISFISALTLMLATLILYYFSSPLFPISASSC